MFILLKTYPTVLDRLFPTLATLANSNNNFKTIVLDVKRLAPALGSIANDGNDIVFEHLGKLFLGIISAFPDAFFRAPKIKGFKGTNGAGLNFLYFIEEDRYL